MEIPPKKAEIKEKIEKTKKKKNMGDMGELPFIFFVLGGTTTSTSPFQSQTLCPSSIAPAAGSPQMRVDIPLNPGWLRFRDPYFMAYEII